MLKFFRKIRRKLIDEGNLKKYLIYAIGEILLVMIGILIALEVNNWNEQKKSLREELVALEDLSSEFIQNKENLKVHIFEKEKAMQKWEKLIGVISNKHLPEAQKMIERPETGSVPFFSSNSTLNSLLFSGKIDKVTNDTLKKRLTSWNDITKPFVKPEELHLNFTIEMFLPYERTILPDYIGEQSFEKGFESPFVPNKDRKKMLIKAYNDIQYQNLLIRNHYWLEIVSKNGHNLIKEYDKMLRILESEIEKK